MISLAEGLSLAAITISVASLGVSGYVAFRDRARLKITSRFITASEYGPSRIIVEMVNVGRRPVILRLVGGTSGDRWGSQYLESRTEGKRLGEHERHEHVFAKEDTVSFNPEGEDLFYEELWVEDSLGVRHFIPGSREHIKKLWA